MPDSLYDASLFADAIANDTISTAPDNAEPATDAAVTSAAVSSAGRAPPEDSSPSGKPRSSPPRLQRTRTLRSNRADATQSRFKHAMQVQTDAGGYNSGRTYYLQAADAAECDAIAASLAECGRRARKAAEAKSRVRRIQAAVCRAYESPPFQSFVVLLIVAVRRLASKLRRASPQSRAEPCRHRCMTARFSSRAPRIRRRRRRRRRGRTS